MIWLVLGLAVLAIPVAVVWLVAAVLRLRGQVRDLDARLGSIAVGRAAQAPAGPPVSHDLAEDGIGGPVTAPGGLDPFVGRVSPTTDQSAAAPSSPLGPAPWAGRAAGALAEPPGASPDLPPDPSGGPAGPLGAGRLGSWLAANWIHAVSAVSLALAGLFLVQYGAERGLLTPGARVLAALALGVALLAAGEVVRRRFGDEGATSTRVLPSTFSAAGLVVLYGAVLAARGLYGLIGPEAAFAGLLATALVGLAFGWVYGPFLAAGAVLGAGAAPFLVGGSGGDPGLLHAFYGLLGLSGLAVDALRRWGWVSGLALGVAFGGASLVWAGLGGTDSLAALSVVLALAAVAVPRLELWPTHPGPSVATWAWARGGTGEAQPSPPVLVAQGGVAAASVLLWLVAAGSPSGSEGVLALGALLLLALVLVIWPARAPALEDAALVPTLLALAVLAVVRPFVEISSDGALPRPWPVALALGGFLLVSAAAHARGLRDRRPVAWGAASALLPLAAAAVMEVAWRPAASFGPWLWALHVLAAAGLATLFAVRHAARGHEDRRPVAYAALSALSLVALALAVVLSDAALTVALAALVATAAALDRRFRLPEMTWFVQLGIAALGWRLVASPGLPAYLDPGPGGAPWGEVLLAFGAALAGLWAAMVLLPRDRAATRAAVEGALLAYLGVLACVVVHRWASTLTGDDGLSHWSAGICATIWGTLALAQAARAGLGGPLAIARQALAELEAAAAALFLIIAVGLNPFLADGEVVGGPWPLDTLLLGYALPAAGLALAARRAPWPPRRGLLAWPAGGLGALWAFLAIRRAWHGNLHWTEGFIQPEMYAYTVALLAAGGLLLHRSIARRSPGLRRLATAVIGLAIAKVFLVDAAGLTGLLRVFSFLALGLVLAGLAWLDRWAADRAGPAA